MLSQNLEGSRFRQWDKVLLILIFLAQSWLRQRESRYFVKDSNLRREFQQEEILFLEIFPIEEKARIAIIIILVRPFMLLADGYISEAEESIITSWFLAFRGDAI